MTDKPEMLPITTICQEISGKTIAIGNVSNIDALIKFHVEDATALINIPPTIAVRVSILDLGLVRK
jgi:hypothetical protein